MELKGNYNGKLYIAGIEKGIALNVPKDNASFGF
jgi:hypothetical protein